MNKVLPIILLLLLASACNKEQNQTLEDAVGSYTTELTIEKYWDTTGGGFGSSTEYITEDIIIQSIDESSFTVAVGDEVFGLNLRFDTLSLNEGASNMDVLEYRNTDVSPPDYSIMGYYPASDSIVARWCYCGLGSSISYSYTITH